MDGYAVRAADTVDASETTPVTLNVVADLPAGHAPSAPVGVGQAVAAAGREVGGLRGMHDDRRGALLGRQLAGTGEAHAHGLGEGREQSQDIDAYIDPRLVMPH